jgi:DNA-binding MarR family transcriptional regulator
MDGHELALSLRSAYLALHRRTDAALAPSGVTADQFVVLAALADSHASTQRELVERTGSDPNTLRAMLVLLEARGLVSRKPHATDRRARSVHLTPKGRTLCRRLWRDTEAVRAQLLSGLGERRARSLQQSLVCVSRILLEPGAGPVGQLAISSAS